MNIVLTFDDSYVQHASVLIASVCSNNDGLINFFIISDYISEQNVKHINELVYAYIKGTERSVYKALCLNIG